MSQINMDEHVEQMTIKQVGIAVLSGVLSLTLHVLDRYEDHWWWDNASHISAGICLGILLPGDKRSVVYRFVGIATLWETYEWIVGMPRSMGDKSWDVDRRVEDTILDTVVGIAGVIVARLFK